MAQRLCRFLGDISCPIYIAHYPLVYTYTAWVATHKVSLREGLPVAALVCLAADDCVEIYCRKQEIKLITVF